MTTLEGPGRKVVFLHVMKTGGITFGGILSSIFGDRSVVIDDPSIPAIEAAIADADAIEFHSLVHHGKHIHAHTNLMRESRLDLLQGHDIFTMVRDPVEHFVSLYHHVIRTRAYSEPIYTIHGLRFPATFEEYLDAPHHFNNQTAFLAARGSAEVAQGHPVDRADLEQVKRMLLDLQVHAGITERFADSVHIFECVTGRTVPGRIIYNRNQNPNRTAADQISAELRQQILAKNALDAELYAFCKELFFKDLAHCGPTPSYTFVSASTAPAAPSRPSPEATVPRETSMPEQAATPGQQSLWTRIRSIFR